MGGGAFLKQKSVEILESVGHEVQVISVGDSRLSNNSLKLFDTYGNRKLNLLKQRFGFCEDYLDSWTHQVIKYLEERVKPSDVLICTCGGELGPIKAGSLIKNKLRCKFYVHFHDPLDHATINLERLDWKYHVKRDRFIYKYLQNCDGILTSTSDYKRHLETLNLNTPIDFAYFGVEPISNDRQNTLFTVNKGLNLIYGGTDGYAQQSSQIFKLLDNSWSMDHDMVHSFGGTIKNNRGIRVTQYGFLERDEFIKTLSFDNMLGYVSLKPNYFRNCIPSKIYDLIAMKIPILAIMPYGECFNLIRHYKIGCSVVPGDKDSLRSSLNQLRDPKFYNKCVDNMEFCELNMNREYFSKQFVKLIQR